MNAIEEMSSRGLFQRPVLGIRAQQVNVLVGRVALLPFIATEGGRLKQLRSLEFVGLLRDIRRSRVADADTSRKPAPVAILGVDEELRVAAEDMVGRDRGEYTTRRQGLRRLGHSDCWIEPVKRCGRHDGVEGFRRQWPFLKCRHRDRDIRKTGEPSTGRIREIGAQLDRRDLVTTLGQRHRRLARTRPELEDASPWTELGKIGQVIKQFRRVSRSRAIVKLGSFVEGPAEWRRYFIPVVAMPRTK